MRIAVALALAALTSVAHAQEARAPAAVIADQPGDAAHPPRLVQTRYTTGGVHVPARWFIAAGTGSHPTVLLLHGFPGTELNLDLARAMQRAGWNVMAVHYRGVWGAPGQFSLSHTVEDARAALVWLRQPARAAQVDASRIVVLGHSMGGFDTVMIGDDAGVAGFVTISAVDNGAALGALKNTKAREAERAAWEEDASFTNMSYDAMVDEALANQTTWDWRRNAAEMAPRPVLVIDSNDGLEKDGDAIAAAVIQAGGPAPTRVKFDTDHSYNDHRVALASVVVNWLGATFPRREEPTRAEGGAPSIEAESETLRRLRSANNAAMAARDVGATMSIAANDYVLVGGNDGIIRSKSEMQALWTRDFDGPQSLPCVRKPDQFSIGDYAGVRRAAEIGSWECPRATPQGEERLFGRYLAHWTKRSGAWRVVSDNYVTLGCRGVGCK